MDSDWQTTSAGTKCFRIYSLHTRGWKVIFISLWVERSLRQSKYLDTTIKKSTLIAMRYEFEVSWFVTPPPSNSCKPSMVQHISFALVIYGAAESPHMITSNDFTKRPVEAPHSTLLKSHSLIFL